MNTASVVSIVLAAVGVSVVCTAVLFEDRYSDALSGYQATQRAQNLAIDQLEAKVICYQELGGFERAYKSYNNTGALVTCYTDGDYREFYFPN